MGITLSHTRNLKLWLDELKQQGQKLVLTNGCFDILHVGHVRYLQAAAQLGDVLLVGVNSDASVRQIKPDQQPPRPINAEQERAEILNALACVDYTYIFEESTADSLIRTFKPDIYVKGGDYTIDSLPERDSLLACACEVVFLQFHEGHSSTRIIEQMGD